MENDPSFATFLAGKVTSDIAHQAVLESGQRWPMRELARNQSISDEIWAKLAARKGDVDVTRNLVIPNLSDKKIRTLLKDKRSGIQELIFTTALGSISLELAQELADHSTLTQKSAECWLQSGNVPKNVLAKVATAASVEHLVSYLSDSELFTDSQVLELLPTLSTHYLVRDELGKLFDIRPELIKEALKIDKLVVLEALAGCRHIFDPEDFLSILARMGAAKKTNYQTTILATKGDPYIVRDVLLAILNNPNSSHETAQAAYSALEPSHYLNLPSFRRYVKLVENGERKEPITVDWNTLSPAALSELLPGLIPRHYPTLEYAKSLPPDRLHPKAPLGPTKKLPTKPRDLATLKASSLSPDYQIPQTQLLAEIQTPLDAKGITAWTTLLALCPEWESSVGSLVETAISLAS